MLWKPDLGLGETRKLVVAMLNLTGHQTCSCEDVKEAVGMNLGLRTEVGVQGWKREEKV